MFRLGRRTLIIAFYILLDVIFMSLSIFLACWIRQTALSFPVSPDVVFFGSANPFRFLFLFWIVVAVFINNTSGLYQTKREIFETIEIWEVFRAVLLASFITIIAIYLTKLGHLPRSILVLGTIFMFLFTSLWRVMKRIFVVYLVSQGYNNFNVLIVGAGKVGTALAEEIRKRPGLGLKIVGYLDDFKETAPSGGGIKIIGKIADFPTIVRREFIDKVFITIHHDSQAFLQTLEQAKELGVAVRVIPQGFELMGGEFSKYNIGFIPILEYCEAQVYHGYAGKRVFDFLTALCGFIFLLPFFLVIAVIIKLDSPGPVFYLSRRYGRGGRIFPMYKFRSMVWNAEQMLHEVKDKNEVDGPIFKIKMDPRITRVGRFLRKYSLDELPQLLNVLQGQMSLVGPRPLPVDQVWKEDLRQLKRLEVRPGITGLWQIRGRSDLSFERLVRWDVWYINNWSFGLDFNILLQTIPVVLKGKGAY